jgi:hypothetical protein
MYRESPPRIFIESNVAPAPEKEGYVGQKRKYKCDPEPDIFAPNAELHVILTDPTPILRGSSA